MPVHRLTRLAPKPNRLEPSGGGFGGMTQSDVAHACAGMPGHIYDILICKYVYPMLEQQKPFLQRIYRELIMRGDRPDVVIKVVAVFISNNNCGACNGTGTIIKRNNRAHVDCGICGGSGIIAHDIQREEEKLYHDLADAEAIAKAVMSRRLRNA